MSEENKKVEELPEEKLEGVSGGRFVVASGERIIADLPTEGPAETTMDEFRRLARKTGKSGIRRSEG